VRRLPESTAKLTTEVCRREARRMGKRGHVERFAVACVDKVFRAEEMASWMDGRHLRERNAAILQGAQATFSIAGVRSSSSRSRTASSTGPWNEGWPKSAPSPRLSSAPPIVNPS